MFAVSEGPQNWTRNPASERPCKKLQLHRIACHVAYSSFGKRRNNVTSELNNLQNETLLTGTNVRQFPTKAAQVLQARTNLETKGYKFRATGRRSSIKCLLRLQETHFSDLKPAVSPREAGYTHPHQPADSLGFGTGKAASPPDCSTSEEAVSKLSGPIEHLRALARSRNLRSPAFGTLRLFRKPVSL